MLQVTYTDRFRKRYKKLSDQEKNQFKQKLTLFVSNPISPVSSR